VGKVLTDIVGAEIGDKAFPREQEERHKSFAVLCLGLWSMLCAGVMEVFINSLAKCLPIGGDLWCVLFDGHACGAQRMNAALCLVGFDCLMPVLAD
jgi:hypothetical protein